MVAITGTANLEPYHLVKSLELNLTLKLLKKFKGY